RLARHEKIFDQMYHEKEREDYALFSTPFLTQFNLCSKNRDENFILFASFANLAENENDLRNYINLGNKYNKLNFMPMQTIEDRASHATTDKSFIKEYIIFFQEFIVAAMENHGQHYREQQLQKVILARKKDKTY